MSILASHAEETLLKITASLKDRKLCLEALFLVVKGCSTKESHIEDLNHSFRNPSKRLLEKVTCHWYGRLYCTTTARTAAASMARSRREPVVCCSTQQPQLQAIPASCDLAASPRRCSSAEGTATTSMAWSRQEAAACCSTQQTHPTALTHHPSLPCLAQGPLHQVILPMHPVRCRSSTLTNSSLVWIQVPTSLATARRQLPWAVLDH